jgi:phage terminase large subunit-like protein
MLFDDISAQLDELRPEDVGALIASLKTTPEHAQRAILAPFYDWQNWARPAQLEPKGNWRTWVLNAGRGYGKTRTGASTVQKNVVEGKARRVALVSQTASDVRDVMVEGPSGILAVAAPWERPAYYPSKRKLVWHCLKDRLGYEPVAFTYTAEKPDKLRGPEHDFAWADELGSWRYHAAWSNLQFGLRQGDHPRCVVTTTPKPSILIKKLYSRASTVITGGSTYENAANLADSALEEFILEYHGTTLGRQELMAELLEEAEGALWLRQWIDDNRIIERDEEGHLVLPDLDALVVAIDPAVTAKKTSDETGIIVVGRESRVIVSPVSGAEKVREHFYIVDDGSGRHRPDQWAEAAIELRQHYEADYILGEVNNGGDLVEFTIHAVDETELFESVTASRGKQTRAHPVAAAARQGRIHHVGELDELEDQLCNWIPGGTPEYPNDRLDAMVWGVSKLMKKATQRPRRKNLDLSQSLGKSSHFRGSH